MVDGETNILLISVDSLRGDHFPSYEQPEAFSSQIESIGDASISTNNMISPSSWTLQVHASTFTGLYPPEHQVLDKGNVLGDHPTITELLKEAGYETHSFGWNGWLETGGVLRGFEHHRTSSYIDESSTPEIMKRRLNKLRFKYPWKDEITIRKSLETMNESERPFFSFVHLNDVHHEYIPQKKHLERFVSGSLLPYSMNVIQQKRLYGNKERLHAPRTEAISTLDFTEHLRTLYRSCVSQMDELLAEFVSSVLSTNDDTIVIIFGDHGDMLGEDGKYGHQFTVADEVVRVPLIVIGDEDLVDEFNVGSVVQHLDLYETIGDIADIETPQSSGMSLLDSKQRTRAFTYYSAADSLVERINLPDEELPPAEQHKIWKSPSEQACYYPRENAWSDESSAELKSELRDHYRSLEKQDTKHQTIGDDVIENLSDMGYL